MFKTIVVNFNVNDCQFGVNNMIRGGKPPFVVKKP